MTQPMLNDRAAPAHPHPRPAEPLTVSDPLRRLRAALEGLRVLEPSPARAATLRQALARAEASLSGIGEPVLTVALAGGTGAGKSSLVNALAGAPIAEAGVFRPTTTALRVYHHRDHDRGGLPADLAAAAGFAAHDRPELRGKSLVDTPDLDSYAVAHRTLTRALLRAAGLVLYVFNPQNYRDERTWSVIAEEKRFSSCAAVLNKSDLVEPEELERITEDLRGCFRRAGLAEIRIFRTVAAGSRGAEGGPRSPAGRPVVDDLPALRALLERELREGDVARLVRDQRARVAAHLAAEFETAFPRTLPARLDAVGAGSEERRPAVIGAMVKRLSARLAALEHELAPAAVMRMHERFRGPLRTWFAVTDFVRYGLTGLVRKMLGRGPEPGRTAAATVLCAGADAGLEDVLRAEFQAVQDSLYRAGLPVLRWSAEASRISASRFLEDVAAHTDGLFEGALSTTAQGRVLTTAASFAGAAIPAGFVGFGLWTMTSQLLAGDAANYGGLSLLGHLAAMTALLLLALQGVAGALLPSGARLVRGMAQEAVRAVVEGTMKRMLERYGAELRAEVEELHAALAGVAGLSEWTGHAGGEAHATTAGVVTAGGGMLLTRATLPALVERAVPTIGAPTAPASGPSSAAANLLPAPTGGNGAAGAAAVQVTGLARVPDLSDGGPATGTTTAPASSAATPSRTPWPTGGVTTSDSDPRHSPSHAGYAAVATPPPPQGGTDLPAAPRPEPSPATVEPASSPAPAPTFDLAARLRDAAARRR